MADEKGPWYGRIAEMLAKYMTNQTFTNFLLVMVLVGGGVTVVKLVPVHLQQIQTGYEREGQLNRDLIRELDQNHREERELLYQFIRGNKVANQ